MELRRREYQETQRSCQTLELALEARRHESESKRDWFARRDAERAEEEAGDGGWTRTSRSSDLIGTSYDGRTRSCSRQSGGWPGVAWKGRRRAGASASARGGVGGCRAGPGSFRKRIVLSETPTPPPCGPAAPESIQASDVDEALTSQRPSERPVDQGCRGGRRRVLGQAETFVGRKLAKALRR